MHHQRLAILWAWRVRGRAQSMRIPMEDVCQEAYVGLCLAAARYRPELGVAFSTFATAWIRGVLERMFARETRTGAKLKNVARKKLKEQPEEMWMFTGKHVDLDEITEVDEFRFASMSIDETRVEVQEAIGLLPRNVQQTVWLRVLGYNIYEIEVRRGISQKQVSLHLKQARTSLAPYFGVDGTGRSPRTVSLQAPPSPPSLSGGCDSVEAT
ncbi:sigma-70 family RNA polymerase sigma factor [Alicyclobacillus tolerans]|nr:MULTISPECIES: sigma-70 family RNA polymerase sigma factor [Alicyclobacillus]